MTEPLKGKPNTRRAMPISAFHSAFHSVCVSVRACHLPKDLPSTTTKLGQSLRNERKKIRDTSKRKGHKKKVRRWRVKRSSRIETERHGGKRQPVHREINTDGKRHKKNKEMKETGSCGKKMVKNSQCVKFTES